MGCKVLPGQLDQGHAGGGRLSIAWNRADKIERRGIFQREDFAMFQPGGAPFGQDRCAVALVCQPDKVLPTGGGV